VLRVPLLHTELLSVWVLMSFASRFTTWTRALQD